MVLKRFPLMAEAGTGWPCISFSLGFQSNMSTCVGPPFMKR